MEEKVDKILIVDDDEDVLLAAKMLLKRHIKEVVIEKDPRRIPFLLNNHAFDVILLDMNFSQDTTSGKEGFYWLEQILERDSQAVVILITAFGDVEMAVSALKAGATDFVLKPWQNEKLLATLSSAARLKKSYKEVSQLKQTSKTLQADISKAFKDIIGESDAIGKVFKLIDKVAATDANVLILGENGTGKEMVARTIHQKSLRRDMPFIGVDMGALTESLFESELFGHKKGAFTDAKEDRAGRFEVASGGTLFLDEIGNLSPPLQSKLLTAIQSRKITRIGTHQEIPVDIRLISAANMPVYEMVKENAFRQDLLYRINTIEIQLPPLRERMEDMEMLANHFVKMYANKYRKSIDGVAASTVSKLRKYPWPGNIRELQHAIERAVIMSDNNQLMPEDVFFLAQKPEADVSPEPDSYNLEDMEKAIIRKVVSKYEGNLSKAAEELGLTRASLYRRLEKYDL
ncbi:MAG: sigma-54-dependent Fis family transcriptional regulator [Ekhidna sp.]|nr:sigma-54-dependent Fis family transcriptional regulator [Ekhidna sp.]MBC6409002.1 sigma-54-dependent Fis family transcriptional regulator [Ekhidna sp.]MBC6425925.1 sigma-54-dependent Fis family transcriptional regulator [Ekhidna sp.]